MTPAHAAAERSTKNAAEANAMSSEYYKNLPKKRMGVGALILNDNGEILIVKPSYKDHWSIAGGVIDENESPRTACIREVKEEIGIELKIAKFLCVDYKLDKTYKGESLQFIFFGGRLSDSEIENIVLDGKEIVEYKFVSFEIAKTLLSKTLSMRLQKSFDALKNDMAAYLENGESFE
jgi:8-oxo-dGTP diphosphatase